MVDEIMLIYFWLEMFLGDFFIFNGNRYFLYGKFGDGNLEK